MTATVGRPPTWEGGRPGRRAGSVALALGAALGWASYYLFVLWDTPGTAASAILFYPFAFGGLAFGILAAAAGQGRAFLRQWLIPAAYLRTALMLAMQLSVLASTYLAGPVVAALLSLIGDVVVTPILAAALFAGPRAAFRRPALLVGLLLSLGGGTLAIVGGHRIAAVHGWGWAAILGAPLAVGLYFLLAARASDEAPNSAVVGQSMVGAAVGAGLVAPWIPGGWAGLARLATVPTGLLAVNGLVSFFAAPLLYFASIRREGIVLPPMLMTAIPIFTLAFSVGVLHQPAPVLALLGIPVAVVGAVLTLRAIAPAPTPEERWGPVRS